jgi:hypothetical protein
LGRQRQHHPPRRRYWRCRFPYLQSATDLAKLVEVFAQEALFLQEQMMYEVVPEAIEASNDAADPRDYLNF